MRRSMSVTISAVIGISCGSSTADKKTTEPAFDQGLAQTTYTHQSLPNSDGLAGAAWFDYDNDGDADLCLSNGTGQSAALFRNDGGGQFTDVTAAAGLGDTSGSSGVIAGDFDGDGRIDVLLIGVGGVYTMNEETAPSMYRNNGDGTFTNVTAGSGLMPLDANGDVNAAWSGSAADLDGDGDLDIFITAPGLLMTGAQTASHLYRNDGGFAFTDVTSGAGLGNTNLGACASAFSDYDNDGDVDLFVANCVEYMLGADGKSVVGLTPAPVQLFRNEGNLMFTDVTEASGLSGYPGFWMGLSFADFNHDGNIDFFSTNAGFVSMDDRTDGIASYPEGLFVNNGDGTFKDVADTAAVANFEFSWGASFADFDDDGYADILFAGSMPLPPSSIIGTGLANPGRLFFNPGVNKVAPFIEDTSLPIDLSNDFTSGVATADVNNDGFLDALIVREPWPIGGSNGTPVVLMNQGNSNQWVGVQLHGRASNPFGVGARVIVRAGGMCQTQEVYVGTSFGSTDSGRLNFGLGQATKVDSIDVAWPSGVKEEFAAAGQTDQIYSALEGTGAAVKSVSCAGK